MKHTLEIGRRPVAIMNASFNVAQKWFASEAFKEDLRVLRDANGRSLFNGEGEPVARPARDEEIAKWDAARAAGDADEEDKADYFAFLLPVSNPENHGTDNKLLPARI
jgi:hypothetical protein